jgi:beta-N-acetylhexosaminidase
MFVAMNDSLGQLLVIGFDGTTADAKVRDLLARIRPAGVILFARNLETPAQVRELTRQLQETAVELGLGRLLIGTDHEGGRVVRMGPPVTRFPGNAALAATGSLDLARRQGAAMAQELLAMGINWDFAPCIDVNSNPNNPVIGVRSFGDNPEIVSQFGVAMIEAMQAEGLIACAKHFPGHGDTEVDSHFGLPTVSRPIESLREIELPPFRAAIAANVASIMTAHIVFPALDEKVPATASHRIITGLLREELGYDGVVVSDAIDMAGFKESLGVEAGVVAAVNAGVDLVLACNSEELEVQALAILQKAGEAGELDKEMVARAQARVMNLKDKYLKESRDVPLEVVGCDEHKALEEEIDKTSRG